MIGLCLIEQGQTKPTAVFGKWDMSKMDISRKKDEKRNYSYPRI